MRPPSPFGPRIATSLGLAAALLLAELVTFEGDYTRPNTVYAADSTPSPVPTVVLPGQGIPTPTPAGVPGSAAPTLPGQQVGAPPAGPNLVAAAVPASQLQQVSDQIAATSQQVSQAVQDPTLSVDAKVQRITALAVQFNQLVAQWQQLLAQAQPGVAGATAPACGPACGPQAPASVAGIQASPTLVPASSLVAPTPSPSTPAGLAPVGPTADQLRAQLTDIAQQMAQVSADPTLSADAKTTQLGVLGAEFNLLMAQLKQLGG
jgi:hypothetical protein